MQIYLMISNKHISFQDISDGYCQCSICVNKSNLSQDHQQTQYKDVNLNSLVSFLKYFPKGFPLAIVPTAFAKDKLFYDNRQGNRLNFISYFSRITQHFPLAVNVCLFYYNKISICHKYEIMKEDNSYLYIQGYSSKIPLCISYKRDDNFMDQVLHQKFEGLSKSMSNQEQKYAFSEAEKTFIHWIHKQYEDYVFCKFMTKLYCQFVQNVNRDIIHSAEFEWIVEKIGTIRLINVKDIVIQEKTKTTSFQEQYEQKILEKLNKKQPYESKIFQAFVNKPKLNYRVNAFRNQIREIFTKQKSKILEKTEQQRTVQTKTQSDEVARLFLPQLHQYSSLREVLNDEVKFKKVVLGIDEEQQARVRNNNPYPRFQTTPRLQKKVASSAPKNKNNNKKSNRFRTEI